MDKTRTNLVGWVGLGWGGNHPFFIREPSIFFIFILFLFYLFVWVVWFVWWFGLVGFGFEETLHCNVSSHGNHPFFLFFLFLFLEKPLTISGKGFFIFRDPDDSVQRAEDIITYYPIIFFYSFDCLLNNFYLKL